MAAGVAAAPRFAGKLADLLPLQNTVGTAVQSLVVLGVAAERGVDAPAERVSLLARVLLGRDLPTDRVEPLLRRAPGTYREDALGETDERRGARGTARTLWRAARLLAAQRIAATTAASLAGSTSGSTAGWVARLA